MGFLRSYEAQIYAAARIVFGFLFLAHGVQKFMAGAAPESMPAPMFWTAAVLELVGGAMIMIGLLGGIAAFICSGLMAAAYFIAHNDFGGGAQGLLPINNKGELAVLYCWAFLFIAARGSGIWSVDSARGAD